MALDSYRNGGHVDDANDARAVMIGSKQKNAKLKALVSHPLSKRGGGWDRLVRVSDLSGGACWNVHVPGRSDTPPDTPELT